MNLIHFSLVGVREKKQVFLEVIIQAAGGRGVSHLRSVIAEHVHLEDLVRVGEINHHFGRVQLSFALIIGVEVVAFGTSTFEAAVIVFTLLITKSPLLAFVTINACSRIIRHLFALRTKADTTLQRTPTGVFTAQRSTLALRTSRFLVRAIKTVLDPVAEFTFFDAFGRLTSSAVWTVEFIVWTGNGRTIFLVRSIRAVLISVAPPPCRYTQGIFAPELAAVTGREIAVLFVGSVPTLIPVVALLVLLDALFAIFTSKLGQLAGHLAVACILVGLVPAVVVPVAFFCRG